MTIGRLRSFAHKNFGKSGEKSCGQRCYRLVLRLGFGAKDVISLVNVGIDGIGKTNSSQGKRKYAVRHTYLE